MDVPHNNSHEPHLKGWVSHVLWFCLTNKLVVILVLLLIIGWGLMVAPFDWNLGSFFYRDPVPVDAIPDIGENQQIVFSEWPGRSPQDIEDQVTYPLTTALLGIPGVKTIRSYSMFGFSTIYIIFKEDIEFYWSRSRVLEKLSSLPPQTIPEEVQPRLGPDATALGQVFWYTLEGRDSNGNVTGGWSLHELRTIQDWYVRYSLQGAEGVSEVASIGGFVKEYQVDVDPDAMRAFGVTLNQVYQAVRMSNLDVGAQTIEVNKAEYVIRGIGFIKTLQDIESSVVKVSENVPVYVKDVAVVTTGPAFRRGALDKEGAEVVGGVVVVRYAGNPLEAIKNIRKKIAEIEPGLPQKTLSDGTVSHVKVVPFYDRTGLIYETLNTLNEALYEEILVSVIVILVLLLDLKSSVLVSGLLPIAVLMCFIAMKLAGVDANIVALSGIAIAIGTMVDMGIVMCENIIQSLNRAGPDDNPLLVVYQGCSEVGSAVLSAVTTTIVSFLPVFFMEGPEGKLFKPLAFTKTFALFASVIVALTLIPPFAHMLFVRKKQSYLSFRRILYIFLVGAGIWLLFKTSWWIGAVLVLFGVYRLAEPFLPEAAKIGVNYFSIGVAVIIVAAGLSAHWLPLGPEHGFYKNLTFVGIIIGGLLLLAYLFKMSYRHILGWCLNHKILFLSLPVVIFILGLLVWQGFNPVFGWLPEKIKAMKPVYMLAEQFPGIGKEFMPPLDEGAYLFMPTTMPHASIGEVMDVIQKQDMAISQIPEVSSTVGKLGRAESPLDPADISMIETVVNYKSEYLVDENSRRLQFRFDPDATDYFRAPDGTPLPGIDGLPYVVHGRYIRDKDNQLIPDPDGYPFRLWRPALAPDLNPGRKRWKGIQKPDDIWDEIVKAGEIPGTTSAPKLQPIAARIVMLQSGMRASMGIKVRGQDLKAIENVGFQIEQLLKQVPSVEPASVIADRVVGKPYLEINIDRKAIARYGIKLKQVQEIIEVAIGGKPVTTTVEGRERYPVRVRYMRELRDNLEAIGDILVPAPDGAQIPLTQLATISYVRGPQVIKSEDTFLVGYVLFDKKSEFAEVDVVEQARAYLEEQRQKGLLQLPPGVSYTFAGTYENQVRSEKKLKVVLPLALGIIFLILYMQFRRVTTSLLVFSGIFVAWAGGFIFIWLYSQSWFLNFSIFGTNMQNLFQVHPFNLSVAVWVGFLALFGVTTDDGVIMGTYLDEVFSAKKPNTVADIRTNVIEAGLRRIRPAIMTEATTILSLIPVLTSTGRGSEIMLPMAIPSFGGMVIETISMLIVPVLYCAIKEFQLRFSDLTG